MIPLPAHGAEDVVVVPHGPDEGAVFTGTEDGTIWRVRHDGERVDKVAEHRRPSARHRARPDGRLVVCDAKTRPAPRGHRERRGRGGRRQRRRHAGWSSATTRRSPPTAPSGSPTRRRSSASTTGRTTSSRTPAPGGCSGATRTAPSTVVLDGPPLRQRRRAVGERGLRRRRRDAPGRTVVRLWLPGEQAGQRDLLCQDLPGYPDNIARGSDGLIWVTIASPRDPLVERLQTGPDVAAAPGRPGSPTRCSPSRSGPCGSRRTTTRARSCTTSTCRATDYHMVTGVREHDGRVWMGSLEEPAVAFHQL